MSEDLARAVEAAFARFALVYGTQAVMRFAAGQDMDVVRRHWAHELRGLTSLDVLWAMEHLPEGGMPNLMVFKALCRRRPEPALNALPEPVASREARDAAKVEMGLAVGRILARGSRETAWQQPLLERYARADARLTKFQRDVCEELLAKQRARGNSHE